VTSYFNISNFNLLINSTTSVTVVPAKGTTYIELFPSGTYQYGTTTGASASVTLYPIIYSLSNYGINPSTFKPYGLFTPSPAAGTLNIFPSFEVTSENTNVAGSSQLNPGDELTLTFYNLPSYTSFVAVTAIGNGTLLPTSPYLYPAEENYESYYTGYGYYVETIGTFTNDSFTSAITPVSGEATVNVLVPNAPYYPMAKLGLEYEITYTPELVLGTISPYAFVSNCTLWTTSGPLEVYPFYQVFTSNANGYFIFNGVPEVFLFGNYLLVRGFGFTTSITPSEYPAMTIFGAAAYSTLTPITSVQSDGYGDFAYVSQVPISGPFYNSLVVNVIQKTLPGFSVQVAVSVQNPTVTSIMGNATFYYVYLGANPNSAIVYVDPAPVVYPPTPIVTGLLGAIQMPTTLLKYPFEATQYIVNGTTHLIPVRNGTIGEIVVVGAGFNANVTTGMYGSVLLEFYIEGYESDYFGSVNVSQVAPFGDSGFSGTWVLGGYGVFYNVPVPDLPGNAGWMPSGNYPYEIVITNVTSLPGAGESGPASTWLYVGKAADLLIGTYSLAYMLTNYTTGAAVIYYSPLITQNILVLPGTPVTAYVFGSPISEPTGEPLSVYVKVSSQCGALTEPVLIGYIINGTLWTISSTGQYVKGSHLTAGTTLPLCPGLNTLSGQITGPYVPTGVSTGTTVTYPSTPASLYVNYIASVPAYPVQFTLAAPGSVSAGTALEVLASSQVSVMGLPAYQVSPYFIVSAPTVTAYVVTSSGVVKQLSVSLLTTVGGYYVYLVSVPSNASGTLLIEATVTATYRFTGQPFVGQQAAAVGILPPAAVNTTAITSVVSQAVKEIEANVTGEIGQVLSYLSSVNSSLSEVSTAASQLSAAASQISSLSTYMASNFSMIESSLSGISSGISTLQGNLVALGAEVGSIGANVLELTKSVNTLTSYETAALSYLTSMNSTLGSLSSQLSSVSSTLSSVSSTVSSMSSTLSGVSSSLGTISSDLSTVSSDLSSISGTLSSMSGTLSSVSSTVTSMSSQLSSVSSTVTSISSTASSANTEATHAAQLAASAATYSLAALIVAIIALALIAYVAFAKM
jgi:protein involved in polysaccharide export with SLBB domain